MACTAIIIVITDKYYTHMARDFFQKLGVGNLLTILSVIFAAGLFYGKINSTVDEFKTLRSSDISRIEKIETSHEILKNRVNDIEKNNVEVRVDLNYIKLGIEEIKRALNGKAVSGK